MRKLFISMSFSCMVTMGLLNCGDSAVPGCDEECPQGFTCYDGRCRMSCSTDTVCGPTGTCESNNFCSIQCQTGTECPSYDDGCVVAPALCRNGLCEYPGACTDGQECYNASCRNLCTDRFNCDFDEKCEGNQYCVGVDDPECTGHDDCITYGSGYQCWEGECHQPCPNGNECPTGYECIHSVCFMQGMGQCDEDADCNATNPCYITPGNCNSGTCEYDYVSTGTSCDDGRACTINTTCDSTGQCSGGSLNCPAPVSECNATNDAVLYYTTGTCATDGSCEFPTPLSRPCNNCSEQCAFDLCAPEETSCTVLATGNTGICRKGVCIDTCENQSDCAIDNPCISGSCETSSTYDNIDICVFDFNGNGTPCDSDNNMTNDGICLALTDVAIPGYYCSSDYCYAQGHIIPDQESGTFDPCNYVCDTATSMTSLQHPIMLGECDADCCPLGCRETPAPHCVQPSNWGFWDGSSQHLQGLSLEWIKGNSTGVGLLYSSGTHTIVINTNAAGAPDVSIDGNAVDISDDWMLIDQKAWYESQLTLPSGVSSYTDIPDIVALRFSSINLGSDVTLTCMGQRPLALTASGGITINGSTVDVQCGTIQVGRGSNAVDQPAGSHFDLRGGGGGALAGTGGNSGEDTNIVSGGSNYGSQQLQPLLPGSSGGHGGFSKQLYTDDLFPSGSPDGSESDIACWISAYGDNCSDSNQQVPPYTFQGWQDVVWDAYTSDDRALGGQSGGSIQMVSLTSITVGQESSINANGQPGESALDCSNTDATGIAANDYYPSKASGPTSSVCGYCSSETETYCTTNPPIFDGCDAYLRSWDAWLVQTGAGGGSGGSILIEAPLVSIDATSRISATGGAGGAACADHLYVWGEASLSTPRYSNHTRLCKQYATTAADGTKPAGVHIYTYANATRGANGADTLNGTDAPYGALSAYAGCDTNVEFSVVSGSAEISWGGGGGSVGYIRINDARGDFTCPTGDCTSVFSPDDASAYSVGEFPTSGNTQN